MRYAVSFVTEFDWVKHLFVNFRWDLGHEVDPMRNVTLSCFQKLGQRSNLLRSGDLINTAATGQYSSYRSIQQLQINTAATDQYSSHRSIQQLQINTAATDQYCTYRLIHHLQINTSPTDQSLLAFLSHSQTPFHSILLLDVVSLPPPSQDASRHAPICDI